MRRLRSAALIAIVATFIAAMWSTHAAHAARRAAPGGALEVALPDAMRDAFTAAHTAAPLLEIVDPGAPARDRLAHPPLPGLDLRSWALAAVESADGYRTWRLVPRAGAAGAEAVSATVSACLLGDPVVSGPAAVVLACALEPAIRTDAGVVVVSFAEAVGPFPELLLACPPDPEHPPSGPGPFAARDGGVLEGTAGGPGGPPLLSSVTLRAPDAPAGLRVVPGRVPDGGGVDVLVARTPDVLFLVQGDAARERDPFGLADGDTSFRRALRAELLLAVFWGGRGAAADTLLPPGLAPSRPMRPSPAAGDTDPPAITPLPPGAPALALPLVGGDDPLLRETRSRLGAMLRSRGWALRDLPSSGDAPTAGAEPLAEARLVRWRPTTRDPGLAILALSGRHPELVDPGLAHAPAAALLHPDADRRTEAALSWEAAWREQRRVIPLLTAQRWVLLDPQLRGVRLRDDGMPLLHDAWFAGAP